MAIVSLLLHAEIGRNDHREDVPHFIVWLRLVLEQDYLSYEIKPWVLFGFSRMTTFCGASTEQVQE